MESETDSAMFEDQAEDQAEEESIIDVDDRLAKFGITDIGEEGISIPISWEELEELANSSVVDRAAWMQRRCKAALHMHKLLC